MKSINKLSSAVLALMPILLYYDFPLSNVNIGSVACVLCCMIFIIQSLFQNKFVSSIKSNFFFILFILYVVFSTTTIFVSGKNVSIINFIFILSNMISVLFVWSDNDLVDKKTFIKTYCIASSVSVCFYIFQIVFGFIFQVAIPGKIPFLPLTQSFSGIKNSLSSVSRNSVLNSSYSFFSEQSHFAVFLLPLFHLNMISLKKNKILRAFASIIIALIIVLTNSANGMIGLIIIALIDLFNMVRKDNKLFSLKSFIIIAGFAAAVFVVYKVLNQIQYFNSMFSRLFSDEGNKTSKAGYRIYRGFYIFKTMPIKDMLFGIGYLQLENYVTANNIRTTYDLYTSGPGLEYTNFICQLLLYFGLFGFSLFILSVIKFSYRKSFLQNAFLICLFALWISSSMLFEQTFLFFVSFIVCCVANVKEDKMDMHYDIDTIQRNEIYV